MSWQIVTLSWNSSCEDFERYNITINTNGENHKINCIGMHSSLKSPLEIIKIVIPFIGMFDQNAVDSLMDREYQIEIIHSS